MSRRDVPFVKGAALVVAAFLLAAPQVLAGDRAHAPRQPTVRPQPAPAPVVRQASAPVSISLTFAAPAQPATETAYINLRSPDGQLRRFAVEGGPEAVSSRVVVLRPGESLTIQLTVRK